MTNSLTSLITAALTWAITGLTKNVVIDKFSANRVLAVRALAAVVSLISAILTAIAFHAAFDTTLIGIAIDAVVSWLAAMGIFHVPQSS